MYLNIGADMLIAPDKIIGIFDLDSANTEGDTKKLLKNAEKNGALIQAGYELPKSFLLTEDGKIYLSQYSAHVLKDKTRHLHPEEKDAVKKAKRQLAKVKNRGGEAHTATRK